MYKVGGEDAVLGKGTVVPVWGSVKTFSDSATSNSGSGLVVSLR